MPQDVTAHHRAGGVGRLVVLRPGAARHAARPPAPERSDAATMEIRRRPWVIVVVAVLLLAASIPLAFREPDEPQLAVPVPTFSLPPLPTAGSPPAARSHRPLQAVRQAVKAGPASSAPSAAPGSASPVLLGPAQSADLPALLGSYCRATYGRLTLAASTADGWVCVRLARGAVAIDMDAMCRWRYGDSAWADLGSTTDPRSWRCYRDGP